MGIEFTPEQKKVTQLHNRNILVSAAAGSGKTAVLVERILKMVCDEQHPVDIDRLLIVTFTNAAASEMRERIRLGIAGRMTENPDSEHIQRQSALLHNAQITTIDSFCVFLLRNHFNEIGLDPAFRVMDEGERKLMEQDVLREMLEEKFAEKSPDFHYCVEYFCPGGKEKVLEQDILSLNRNASSHPWPNKWLEERKQDYGAVLPEQLEATEYGTYLLRYLKNMSDGCMLTLEQVKLLTEAPDGPYMYGELVEKELDQVRKSVGFHTVEEYAAYLPTIVFGRLPGKKDDTVDPGKRESAKEMRKQVKEILQGMTESFFTTPLSLSCAQAAKCLGPVNTLISLTQEFAARMQEKKQERNLLDFSDMEHFALDILLQKTEDGVRASHVAREYRQHFHEILIDEYQDSNLVQEYLLQAISGEEDEHFNRFMVGDVKQSIYKFRLARPELFLEKYHTYTREEGERVCIDLFKNFRSRPEIVDAVNAVFSRIMSEQMGGIAYDDKAALYAGAVYPDNSDCLGELMLIEKPAAEDKMGTKTAEGLAIAGRIKALRESFQVTDPDTGVLRPVRYGDMVILLRTTSGWDEEFKKVLEEEGIPAYITSKTGYFAAAEVQELLQLLRVLDNPLQDIPLYGAMHSVFGNFTEAEIALLRSHVKGGSLYEALEGWAAQKEEEGSKPAQREEEAKPAQMEEEAKLAQKAAAFLENIERYRAATIYMSIRELLMEIVRDYDYLSYVTALPSGSKRKANVEMLFARAADFEQTSYFGLFHFVRYIEQLEKYDVDYGEAENLDENADVVRIMSIHKSKGLEFPVTFIAGLSKRFNMQDLNKSLVVDMDLGIGADYVNPNRRIRNKTLRRNVIIKKMREDILAEELRVLYVAMTRAKEKMILSAVWENAAQKWEVQKEQGKSALHYQNFMAAGSYLDFLMPVIPGTPIQVSCTSLDKLASDHAGEQIKLLDLKEHLKNAEKYRDKEALEKLEARFSYQYQFQSLEKLYTKTTVSELKIAAMAEKDEAAYHTFEEKELVPYIPAFRRETEAVSLTLRGNAFHRMMELVDFSFLYQGIYDAFPDSPAEFEKGMHEKELSGNLYRLLDREVKEDRLTEEYRSALHIGKLVRFLVSPTAYRMWRADRVGALYREQPFVYSIGADKLAQEFPAGEKVLIQGIIDVYFREGEGLVLMDYKTDRIRTGKELWDRYEAQLMYYEEALSKLTGLPVTEKFLYSFCLDCCICHVSKNSAWRNSSG